MDAFESRDNLIAQWRDLTASSPWVRLALAVGIAVIVGLIVANAVIVGWFVFAVALAGASVVGVQWSMRRAMHGRPGDEVAERFEPPRVRIRPTPRRR